MSASADIINLGTLGSLSDLQNGLTDSLTTKRDPIYSKKERISIRIAAVAIVIISSAIVLSGIGLGVGIITGATSLVRYSPYVFVGLSIMGTKGALFALTSFVALGVLGIISGVLLRKLASVCNVITVKVHIKNIAPILTTVPDGGPDMTEASRSELSRGAVEDLQNKEKTDSNCNTKSEHNIYSHKERICIRIAAVAIVIISSAILLSGIGLGFGLITRATSLVRYTPYVFVGLSIMGAKGALLATISFIAFGVLGIIGGVSLRKLTSVSNVVTAEFQEKNVEPMPSAPLISVPERISDFAPVQSRRPEKSIF